MAKRHTVKITQIICNDPSENEGDELYLLYQADGGNQYRYPEKLKRSHEMDDNDDEDTWNVNLELNFDYEVILQLWDNDDANPDYLQSHDFQPSSGSGSIELKNTNDADYTVYYEYIN